MQLHVLAGSRDLLRPEVLDREVVSNLVGPSIRTVTAYWLWPESGNRYHDFLQEKPGDNRTVVVAKAMKEGFGARIQPLLVLADLLNETARDDLAEADAATTGRRSQLEVLSDILACGDVRDLHLHGVSLSAHADPDECWATPAGIVTDSVRKQMEGLQEELSKHLEANSITTDVIEVAPELPAFRTLYNNALCNQFSRRLEPRLRERGWVPDIDGVAGAISAILARWDEQGMFLGLPMRQDHVEGMSDLLFSHLLQD